MTVRSRVAAWLRGAFLDNAAIKFVSLVLALTIFILVNTGQDVVIGAYVGVSYTMPKDRVLTSERVDQVRITIKGSWRRTKRFDERELDRIHVDLTGRGDGVFQFQEDMIRLPHGLELLSITPQTMQLHFEPLTSRSVPVDARWVGQPSPGYHVVAIKPLQPTVTVRGAESAVSRVRRVSSIEVAVDGHSDDFTERASLVVPPGVELVDRAVMVEVQIAPDQAVRELTGVPVAVRPVFGTGDLTDRFTIEPATVTVTLHGTQPALEAAVEQGVTAYVKLSPDDPGGHPADVLIQAEGVAVVVSPREVDVARRK